MKYILFLTVIFTNSVFAAGGGHGGSPMDLKWKLLNFFLLFGFIAFKIRKPVSEMFTKNAKEVEELFHYADKLDKEASKNLSEAETKLKNITNAKKAIQDEANTEASNFGKKYNLEIDEKIKKFKSDSELRLENDKNVMIGEIRKKLVDEVISKAKSSIAANSNHKNNITSKLLSKI